MKPGGQDIQGIAELSDGEYELFKKAVRTLLAKTFIIRGIPKEGTLYDFAIRNMPLFEAWFDCMDASLVRDEGLGVISFRGGSDMQLRLGREETCALLVFRLLYEEKRTELSLSDFPSVTVFDFIQRYNAMTGGSLKKTRLREILRRLRTHKLIDGADFSDMDNQIILYPSLAISVDRDSIDLILESLGNQSGEEDSPETNDDPEDEV